MVMYEVNDGDGEEKEPYKRLVGKVRGKFIQPEWLNEICSVGYEYITSASVSGTPNSLISAVN